MSKPKKLQYNGSSKVINYIVTCINWLLDNGSGGSDVLVNPIQTTGTKIAEITVDNTVYELYAPLGGSGGSDFDFVYNETDGGIDIVYPSQGGGGGGGSSTTYGLSLTNNILSIVANGGESSVTLPSISIDSALDSSSENAVQNKVITARITSIEDSLNNVYTKTEVDDLLDDVASSVSELTDVSLNNLANGEILKYNSTSQKWENAEESGQSALILDAVKYSTDEQVIGVWADGKPLYQITVISTTAPTSNAWTQVNLPSDISVKKYDAYYNRNGSNVDKFSLTDNSNEKLVAVIRGTVLFYWVSSDYVNDFQNITITFQYTKTTDTAGSGGYQAYGFSPIIYSEEEREVGVWVDNKPLYEKTVNIGIVTTGEHLYDLHIANIERIVSYGSPLFRRESTHWDANVANPVWLNGSFAMNSIYLADGTTKALIYSGYYTTDADVYVTIRYTKTTDTAGSGSYSTLEVPTVHYSTDEQVIGTWIDGKPLYQKTYNNVSLSNNADNLIDSNASGFVIVSYEIIWTGGGSYEVQNYATLSGLADILYVNNQGQLIYWIYANAWIARFSQAIITIKYTKTTD